MRATRRRVTLSGVSLRPLRQRRMSENPRSANRRPTSARRASNRRTRRQSLTTTCNHSATMMGDVSFTRLLAMHAKRSTQPANLQPNFDEDSMSSAGTSNSAVHSSGPRSSPATRPTARVSASRSRSAARRRRTCPTRRASTVSRKRSLSRSRTRRAASSKRARLTQSKSSTNDTSQSTSQPTTNVTEQQVEESARVETPEGSPKPDKSEPDNEDAQLDQGSQNQCCSALFTSEGNNPSMPFLIGVRRRVRTVPTVTAPTPSSISTGMSVSAQHLTFRSSWPECTPAQQTPLTSVNIGVLHEPDYGTLESHNEEASLRGFDASELVVEPDSEEDEDEDDVDCDVNEDLLMEPDDTQPQPSGPNDVENPSESQHEYQLFSSSYSTQEDSIS